MRPVWLLLVSSLLATGCRDSPMEVVGRASEAASTGDLVDVQTCFSVASVQRVERAWALGNVRKSDGWQTLSRKLTFEGAPLEVKSERIAGDYAQVLADAGALGRDYYLRKEDGRWRIELGGGLRYRKALAVADKGSKSAPKVDGGAPAPP